MFLQEEEKENTIILLWNTLDYSLESKTISLYNQGKYVILNLTPSAHPRTFHSLIEFSIANQGYKAFVPSFKAIALKDTEQALSYLKSMLCQLLLLTWLYTNFQGVSCDKAL